MIVLASISPGGRQFCLTVALLLACAGPIWSATITWNTRATIAGNSDVATNGGLLYAYDDSNLSATVNGVTFAAGNSASAFGGNVTVSGAYWYNTTAFGSGAGAPWTNLSAAYQSVLAGGVYASSNVTLNVTLNNLLVGHLYQLQVWVNDTRSGASNRSETVTSPGGTGVSLDYNSINTNGGVGQYAIGTFTADAATQIFSLTNAQPALVGNSAQMNALQVRDLGAPNGSLLADVTLTPATTYQQIYGIGGNLAGGEQLALLNAGASLLTNAFSPGGLNLSFVRVDNPFGQTETAFAGLTNANNTVMRAFRALQPNGKIMMSSWSPPGNLKSTGSAFEGTLAKNAQGQFVYTNFAQWWVNSLQYWRSNSTLPDYVSIQNEPDWYPTSGTNNAWQGGCELTPAEGTYASYAKAFNAVTAALQTNGLGGVGLIAPDPSGLGGSSVQNYLNALPAKSFAALSHHPYGNTVSTSGVGLLSALQTGYPWATTVKFMSEYDGDNWGTNYPDWMGLAVTMHNVWSVEDANAYLVWSLYYGLFYNANGAPATDMYYTVGHFSKFINPGDWRCAATSSDTNLLITCYTHNTGPGVSPRYAVVMINNSTNTLNVILNTSNLWSGDVLQRSWRVYETANSNAANYRLTQVANLQGGSLTNQNQSITLVPYALATAVINSGLASNPTNLLTTVSNGWLRVNWPADHWGWILQVQTNRLDTGLAANWTDQSNTLYGTSFSYPLVASNPAVFFRLRHP